MGITWRLYNVFHAGGTFENIFSLIFLCFPSTHKTRTKHSENANSEREFSPAMWIRGCKHQLITKKISCFKMSSWAFLGFRVDDDVICKMYSHFSSGESKRESGNPFVYKGEGRTTTIKMNVEICSNNYRSFIIKLISSLYILHRDFNLASLRCDGTD